MIWKIIHYENVQKKKPTFEFIQSLDPRTKSKIIELMDLLEEFGIQLGLPHTKKVACTKLRILNPENVRIFYVTVIGKRFILLHGFVKKKQKTDRREIKIAEDRLTDYLNRS